MVIVIGIRIGIVVIVVVVVVVVAVGGIVVIIIIVVVVIEIIIRQVGLTNNFRRKKINFNKTNAKLSRKAHLVYSCRFI